MIQVNIRCIRINAVTATSSVNIGTTLNIIAPKEKEEPTKPDELPPVQPVVPTVPPVHPVPPVPPVPPVAPSGDVDST